MVYRLQFIGLLVATWSIAISLKRIRHVNIHTLKYNFVALTEDISSFALNVLQNYTKI